MATVASIVVNLSVSTARFEKGLGSAQRMAKQFVKSTKSITRDLDEISRYGRRAGLALVALGAAGMSITKIAANHEENMLRVKAVTRATVSQYHEMSNAAIDLSSKTVYSLSQIADGMKFLGMAGFRANEIVAMMPTVTKLATVGAIDMASAADITTNILAGYGLAIEDLGWATDVLASAMTGANVDLNLLGESFKHAGPLAKGAGVEFETTAAVIAMLGNAGIQGSLAGTSLKSAISRLLGPSRTAERVLKRLNVETLDGSGNLRDFVDIIGDLEKAGAKTSDILKIFGLRAGPSMARLVDLGADSLQDFVDRLKESEGLASLIESEQLQSFNAQTKLMRNQFAALGVELGKTFLPAAKTVNYYIMELVDKFRNLTDEQKENIVKWVAVGSAVLGLIAVLGLVAGAISVFVKGLTVMGIIVVFATSPITLALVGIALAAGYMAKAWNENWGGIQDKTKVVTDKLRQYWSGFYTWWNGVPAVTPEGITSGFDEDQPGFKHRLLDIKDSVIGTFQEIWSWLTETSWEEKMNDMKGWLSSGWEWVLVKKGEAWDYLEGTKFAQALRRIRGQLETWWHGVPAVTAEGITSGFDVDQPGFKQKLLDIKDEILHGVIWDDFELTIPDAVISIGLATLAGILAWNILPASLLGLSGAITKGIAALKAGGLILGAVAIAGLTLTLLAGAIGWAFGDKEGRDAFVEAVKESIAAMTFDDPISIPLGIMDIAKTTFEFGTDGLKSLRAELDRFKIYAEGWDPSMGEFEWPEWISELGRGFLEMGLALSDFLIEGFWLGFDLVGIILYAIDRAVMEIVQPAVDLGKAIARAIYKGFGLEVPEWLQEAEVLSPDELLEQYRQEWLMEPQNLHKFNPLWRLWAPKSNDPDFQKYMQEYYDAFQDAPELTTVLEGTESLIQQISTLPEFDTVRNTLAEWNIELDNFLIKLAMSESGLKDITNSVGARGEFQMMPDSIKSVEEFLGHSLDWDDATERAYGSIVWFRMGIESEFSTIEEAAKRLGVTIDEAMKLWWVAGGGNLRNLNSLNTRAWTEPSGQVVTYQDIMDNWRNITGFASGGYTGNAPVDQAVGVVHGQEIVIPAPAVRKGIAGILEWLGIPGFQSGTPISIPGFKEASFTVETMQDLFTSLGHTILEGIATLFDLIVTGIEGLVVAIWGEDKLEEIKSTFDRFRDGLQDFMDKIAPVPPGGDEDPKVEEIVKTALELAFENISWDVPINSFVQSFSSGLMQAENELVQFFGEMARLIKVTFERTKDGMISFSLDLDQMLADMANALFSMVGESLANLLSGDYGSGFAKRQDPFPNLTEVIENVENWDKNHKKLKRLEAAQDVATLSGAAAGAGVGFAIGGPLGALIGGFVGALAMKKTGESLAKKEVEELTQKLQDDFQKIKELLGTTIQDVANGLANAFQADTYEGFVDSFAESLEKQTKNALITSFLAGEIMRPLLDELSNTISLAVVDSVLDENEREEILGLHGVITEKSEAFYNSLQELGIWTGEAADKMKGIGESLRNVPQGLKIVSNRLAVAGANVPGVQAMSASGYEGAPQTPEVHNHFHGPIYGMDDFDRRVNEATGKTARSNRLATYGVG